jgi:pimeloyl-ACP methyl ester carboxylesterase
MLVVGCTPLPGVDILAAAKIAKDEVAPSPAAEEPTSDTPSPLNPECDPPSTTAGPSASLGNALKPVFNFLKPNIGLYWVGKQGAMVRADEGSSNPHYDPSRPTLIYVHGWQMTSIYSGFYESSLRLVLGQNVDLAEPWLRRGWNVGFFLWTEFADDYLVSAEQKIWSSSTMSWLDSYGYRHPFDMGKSTGDILYDAYTKAMQNHAPGTEIRILGHSLGTQLATNLAHRLSEGNLAGMVPDALVPKRVILLDPYFTTGAKPYLQGSTNGELITRYARQFISKSHMTLEIYRTSSLPFSQGADRYPELLQLSAFRNIYTDGVFSYADQAGKHNYAIPYYFLSMNCHQPTLASPTDGAGASLPLSPPSASSSDEDIRRWMSASVQVRSTDNGTADPNDDRCSLESKGTF